VEFSIVKEKKDNTFRRHHHVVQNNVPQQKTHASNFVKPIPLELIPIINSLMFYGEKTNSLGGLDAAESIEAISNELKQLPNASNELLRIIDFADEEVIRLKNKFSKSYDEPDE
jgi:hypothetical protein